MKKTAVVIFVILVLVGLIGFELIGQGIQFLVEDKRSARAQKPDVTTTHRDAKPAEPADQEQSSTRGVAHSEKALQAHAIDANSFDIPNGVRKHHVTVHGEISPVHFIRSSLVTGSTKPSKEQMDRVVKAVDVVAGALRPRALILDADGLAPSGAFILLYARDEFDLTHQVKSIYDALGEPASPAPSVAAAAEQTGVGQPATHPVVTPEGGNKPQSEAEGRAR